LSSVIGDSIVDSDGARDPLIATQPDVNPIADFGYAVTRNPPIAHKIDPLAPDDSRCASAPASVRVVRRAAGEADAIEG
jgi:hypothetical protein